MYSIRRCEQQDDEKEARLPERPTICRDFLRNLCKRGEQCKYFHPLKENGREVYVFCHDFQNSCCTRIGCKFIHCSAEDEEYYNKTGELLPHVYESYRKIMDDLDETGPVCKDYFRGKCKRDTCKYRHLNEQEKSHEEEKYPNKPLAKMNNRKLEECNCCQIPFEYKHCRSDYEDHVCNCKRRRLNRSPELNVRNYDSNDNRKLWVLESENVILRQRLSELTKRNSDLQATNEFLLEQNARLRMGEKTTPSLTAVTVPAVTITNTGTLPQGQVSMQQSQITVPVTLAAVTATPVSLAAVSMAPVQIPPVVTVSQITHTQEGSQLTASIQQEPQLVSYPILNRSALIQGTLSHH